MCAESIPSQMLSLFALAPNDRYENTRCAGPLKSLDFYTGLRVPSRFEHYVGRCSVGL